MTSRSMNGAGILTVVSLAILVGTELFGVAWASGWALAGLFELGDVVAYVFEAVFAVIALVVLAVLVRQAIGIESTTP